MPSQPHGARRDRLLSLGREPGARREGRERGGVELFPQRGAGTAVPSAQARAAVPSAQARRRNVGGVRAGTAAGQGGGEPGDAAAGEWAAGSLGGRHGSTRHGSGRAGSARPCRRLRNPPSAAAREAGPRRAVTAVFAAAAGGERPADPLHRGVPEQGPRHRLRAVSASGRPRAGSRGRWGSAQPRPARR